jgi:hypothetical protein
MRWPFTKRIEAGSAWSLLIFSGAFLIGIPTVLAAVHGTQRHFNPWWPSDWMVIPLVGVAAGVVLLAVPVKRTRPAEAAAARAGEAASGTKVTGQVEVDDLSGEAVGVKVLEVKDGANVEGKAKARKVSKGGRVTGTDAGRVG